MKVLAEKLFAMYGEIKVSIFNKMHKDFKDKKYRAYAFNYVGE